MARKGKDDDDDEAPKRSAQLRAATVAKPCLFGVALLSVLAAALPH